jgi:hypothetical protein
MRTVVAIVLGLLSGFLIYMTGTMLFVDVGPKSSGPSPLFVFVLFIGGWAVSSYFLRRGAASVSRVFSRGALLGAAEWLAIGAAGVIFSGRAVASHAAAAGGSDAATAGAAIGGGIVAMVTGGLSIGMAVVCLIVFAVAHFAGREMADKSGTPTKKCPECAEMVQAEARKCKHCGAVLVLPPPLPSGV